MTREEMSHEEFIFARCPEDAGSDHRWGWQYLYQGHKPPNIWWAHRCKPEGSTDEPRWMLGAIDVSSGTKHTLVSGNPLHIEPSILCVACGDHGFIRDGRWVSA